ncbi:MAG TPA: sugar ABC transporter substrate-binding protein [Clostridiales bacterium]|nr:sugar ABC transporter substrate-binding protein [Clostridiales bacterium]
MKKFTALLLVVCLSFLMAACNSTTAPASSQSSQAPAPASSSQAPAPPASSAAPESSAPEQKELVFALLPKTLTNPYFVAMQEFAEAEAAKLGIKLECIAPPDETKVEEQIAMFETMLEKNVDAILVVPCGTTEIVASIEKANAQGIPVLCLDTNASGGEIASFIGTNNYAGGKLAGEWVSDTIGSGKISIITGTPGNKTHEDRVNGFLDGIKGNPNLVIAGDVVPAYSDRAQGMAQAENLITANPDIKVIYCTNDEMAMGAGEAVKARGLSDQITVIGFDGAPTSAQGILDGIMDASVAQAPGRMAQMGVQVAYELLVNGVQPEAEVDTGCTIVTIENAQEYLSWH